MMAEDRKNSIGDAVNRYGNRLFGFIRKRVPTNADAEDILQEVWYQFSKVVDVGAIEQVSAWLFRVARNKVTDSYRKQELPLYDDYQDADQEADSISKLLVEFPIGDDEEIKEVFWQGLFTALDELPEKQREAFVLNEIEGQTFEVMAENTGENIKTLISRKRYAVQYLRERLQHLYQQFFLD